MGFFDKYYSEAVTIRFVSAEDYDSWTEFIIDPNGRNKWAYSKPTDITDEEDNELHEKMSKIEDILRGEWLNHPSLYQIKIKGYIFFK